jgi:hypothetical protein
MSDFRLVYNNYQISVIFDSYKTELPDIILVGKIRICDGWHGGQNENRVKYGFVTVRDLLNTSPCNPWSPWNP